MKKLNFGCGKVIKKGWINVDIQKYPDIDKSFDFEKFPYPFENDTFDYVLADNVFEHLNNLNLVLRELHRICKDGAKIRIIVPYYNCKGAYNDVTHVHFFNETTFYNLINPSYSVNKNKPLFEIDHLYLKPTRFGKIFPNFIRKYVSYILGEIYSEIVVDLIVKK
jgi:SAM-dependent methyltransferase